MTQNSIAFWYFFVFGHSIFFVKKQWIFRKYTFPSLDRDFAHSFKKFRKNWFKSISLRFQAFIWYQICQHLNCSMCHFITLAKSPSQPSVCIQIKNVCRKEMYSSPKRFCWFLLTFFERDSLTEFSLRNSLETFPTFVTFTVKQPTFGVKATTLRLEWPVEKHFKGLLKVWYLKIDVF